MKEEDLSTVLANENHLEDPGHTIFHNERKRPTENTSICFTHWYSRYWKDVHGVLDCGKEYFVSNNEIFDETKIT